MEENKEILVLTVWKNNSILKNFFLINIPPPFSTQHQNSDINDDEQQQQQEEECYEETFVLGRHPDCDIRLEHPSISRFHLLLHSIPSQHLLFLTDLSSVHGTWVSGKRIDPNTRTRIKEGDTLRIGGSSRIYKLHWIPSSQAYDVSKSFVPPLNFPDLQQAQEEIDKEEITEDKITESALSANVDQSLSNKDQQESQVWSFWSGKIGGKSVCSPCSDAALLSQAYDVSKPFVCPLNFPDLQQAQEEIAKEEITESDLSTIVDQSLLKDQPEGRLWIFWSGKMGVRSVCSSCSDVEPLSESDVKSSGDGYESPPFSPLKRLFGSPLVTSDQKSADSGWSNRGKFESICLSLSDLESMPEFETKSYGYGYQSPKALDSVLKRFGSPLLSSDQKTSGSIWSRRGKLADSPQVLASNMTEGKKRRSDLKNNDHETVSRSLFCDNQKVYEEVFTPDKENLTPNTHRSMRKLAILKDVQNFMSGKSPLKKMTPNLDNGYENFTSPSSGKENYSYRTLMEQKPVRHVSSHRVKSNRLKRRKVERMPFQSLADSPQKSVSDSPQKSISQGYIVDAAMGGGTSINFGRATNERVRQWKVVVDTSSLLNKDSRKALQLLEGLKGTQLIIPAIVIRELACLKRQVGLFRRNTEVLLALEWIQECMVKAQWWIHIQSSFEEDRSVATTPAVSPHSQFSCGLTATYAFTAAEFHPLSPTVEDDVLDYALHFRRIEKPGQVILLSNNITLKIKAMAEGLVCESAEEFRNSLVNPFSERFLWTDSSPRGLTWSCSDDFILRKKFYPSSLKMTPKAMGNVKGLKLIPYLEQTSWN